MKRLLAIGVLGALLIGVALSGIGAPRNPHDFAGRCEECHLVAPTAGQKGIFVYDIDYLCRRCHELSLKNSHPSEMAPSMKMPTGFLLDWQGRMTCGTCHDLHAENTVQNPYLLRGNVAGREFCALCHQRLLTAKGVHQAITGIAHVKSWTPPDRETLGRVLDAVSVECISCHEGSVGPTASFSIAGEETLSFQGRNFSHPIGMDYGEAASRNRQLRAPDYLSPLVSLYEGKVGCTSCHSPFSREADMLVISNRGSALCLECHLK